MLKKWLKRLAPVFVLACAFVIFGLLQANKPMPEKKEAQARVLQVYTTPAALESTFFDVYAQGEVKARTAINLAAQVGGRVEWVSEQFIPGGSLLAGKPILKLEAIDYQLALNQAEASLANAQVLLEKAEADADVARKQLAGVKNPSPLALKIPQVKEAKASLKAAQASVERARLNLERTTVSLPYDARITAVNVQVGQVISMGQALAAAFSTDEVMVRLAFKQEALGSLGLPIGYVAEADKEPVVTFSTDIAGTPYQWRGKLTHIEANIDQSTRMVHAIATLDKPYETNNTSRGMPMAVGLYVGAHVQGRQVDQMISIPRSALRPGNRVFVIENETLKVTEVTVAHSNEDKAYISEGLTAGAKIITSPIRNPIVGMAITSIKPQASVEAESVQ
ncbi:MAG: efflux RND transporter periplasmic adaptor subunit [Halieaceae bacterium]|nr:efflux RND transporter periplasmic adaptor subunit [Halieaceae bacterium]